MKTISQREARRLQKRVQQLERDQSTRVHSWRRDYPGGINVCTIRLDVEATQRLYTAQLLGFALVTKYDSGQALIFAVKQ